MSKKICIKWSKIDLNQQFITDKQPIYKKYEQDVINMFNKDIKYKDIASYLNIKMCSVVTILIKNGLKRRNI